MAQELDPARKEPQVEIPGCPDPFLDEPDILAALLPNLARWLGDEAVRQLERVRESDNDFESGFHNGQSSLAMALKCKVLELLLDLKSNNAICMGWPYTPDDDPRGVSINLRPRP